MVADPLEVPGDEQQVGRRRDVVRILHHVGEQRAEDRIVEIVDRGVALDAPPPPSSGRARRRRRARRGPSRRRSAPFRGAARPGRILAVLDARHPLGDILGIVADPLDHAGDLQRRDDLAQVRRGRRAAADDLDRPALDLGLERVDLAVAADHAGGGLGVAPDERLHRLADRGLGEPAHLADRAAQRVELFVERRLPVPSLFLSQCGQKLVFIRSSAGPSVAPE